MPRAKAISIKPIVELVLSMNKVGSELTALLEWARGMQPDGLHSIGPRMTKERLKLIRRLLLDMGHLLQPAKEFTLEVRTSGHFGRNPTPLSLLG